MLKKVYKKLRKYFEFEPYRKELDINGIDASFFYATNQAKEWYDPLKPYAKLEYEWVIKNIPLKGKKILDGGAHHGQYSVVFGSAAENDCELLIVDPIDLNCTITDINMKLNGLNYKLIKGALYTKNGTANFSNQSNGKLSSTGENIVKTYQIREIMPSVQVLKLDIEGAEREVIPHEIDALENVETWIIELHPQLMNEHPDTLIQLFKDRNYNIMWINREKNIVEKYEFGTHWGIHSTIFCFRN